MHPAEHNGDISLTQAVNFLSALDPRRIPHFLTLFFVGLDRSLLVAFLLASIILSVLALRGKPPVAAGPGLWFLIPGGVLYAVLLVSIFARPDIEGSMPRYSFALAPTVVLAASLFLRWTQRWRGLGQLDLRDCAIVLATVILSFGEAPKYIRAHFPTREIEVVVHDGTDPEAPDYRPPLAELARSHPELTAQSAHYLLFNEEWDGFLSFRVMEHLSVMGYRGHLYSETHTSRSTDRGQRLGAARASLAARNLPALGTALDGIDLVVLNLSEQTIGAKPPKILLKDEFLRLLASRPQFAPATAGGR